MSFNNVRAVVLIMIDYTKVHKKSDFLRPVYKKVKTVTIFVGKKRSAGFPSLIER